jgi:hypothetical protein
MTELTEQQKHLSQLAEQHQQLVNDINNLNAQLNTKRELALKVLGAIEYLEQTGVSLTSKEEVEPEKKQEESPEEVK